MINIAMKQMGGKVYVTW